jgi:hypothetical protein
VATFRGFKSFNKKSLLPPFKFDRISKKGEIDRGTFAADLNASFESRALPRFIRIQIFLKRLITRF